MPESYWTEKKRLIQEGKIKRENSLPEITEEEIPFEIPENWCWCRIGDVFTLQAGKFISSDSIKTEGKYPCYGGNGLRGYVNICNRLGRFPLIGRQGALFVFPLPPLAEQQRIVVAIEDTFEKMKELEKDELKLDHLQKFFPKKMKDSLLQAANQGKLTEQTEADGDARELVADIQKEKERLIKEGKIKKEKALPEIAEDEIPFEIPENWCWVRLGDIGETNIGLTYKPSDVSIDGILVLRSGNIQNDKVDYFNNLYVNCDIPESKRCHVGDILICARNGSKKLVGKAAIVDREGMTFGAFMALYRSLFNKYIYKYLSSPYFRSDLDGVSTTTINQITQNNLKERIVPLPPLSEQQRIVERLEQLLPLCDALE
jgi:type I restriction enzyme S subunit